MSSGAEHNGKDHAANSSEDGKASGKVTTRRSREEQEAEEGIEREEAAVASGAERLYSSLSDGARQQEALLGVSSGVVENGVATQENAHRLVESVRGTMRQEVKERWKPVPPPVTGEPIPVSRPDRDSPPWTSKVHFFGFSSSTFSFAHFELVLKYTKSPHFLLLVVMRHIE
jgi:hypothetical protein